jgi:hypothetical protein
MLSFPRLALRNVVHVADETAGASKSQCLSKEEKNMSFRFIPVRMSNWHRRPERHEEQGRHGRDDRRGRRSGRR